MIPYYYEPILLRIGFLIIYTWGFIVAIGVLLSYYLLKKLNGDKHSENLFILSIISGFIGSRILYIIGHSNELVSFYDYFKVWNGGLDWSGGFVLAVISFIFYVKYYKLNFWRYADLFVLPLVLGFMIGRIGCVFGDGGHLGKETSFFLGAMVDGVLRHYTAVYSVFGLGLLFIFLYYLSKKKRFDGYLFSIYLIVYGISRFFSDFLRDDPVYYGLTLAQYFSVLTFLFGLVVLYIRRRELKL